MADETKFSPGNGMGCLGIAALFVVWIIFAVPARGYLELQIILGVIGGIFFLFGLLLMLPKRRG